MKKDFVVALEEHYWDQEVASHFTERGPEMRNTAMQERLHDLGALRLKEMDEAGIDFQVLSHGAPALQRVDPAAAVALAKGANDRLHQAVLKHPARFAAFAVVPTTADPKLAADELERAVTRLGFKGGMIHGLTAVDGKHLFIDDKRFWPIFERAQALDVPIYMHPAVPHKAVIEAYYKDYLETFPNIMTAAWGFTVETATQGIRLVLSGVFDKYPKLKIILGHLGEGLPFSLWRIDMALQRQGNKPTPFRDTFREHFWITTSGNFSTPAMICSILEMGVDRILFSVDYPFVPNAPGPKWMETVPVSPEDRAKILNGNAKRLLRL
jgi:predicted TIM-barrel fold metal-dependent hydrolase